MGLATSVAASCYSCGEPSTLKLGLTPNALYKYLEGVCHFPVDLVALLYRKTQERAVLDFILEGTDFELVEKLSDDDLHKLGCDWVVELVDKVGWVLEGLSGMTDLTALPPEERAFRAVSAVRELRYILLAIERKLVAQGRR